MNFFHHHLVHHINFDLWTNTSRNLVDLDDVFVIADHILGKSEFENQVINIANPTSNNVKDIVATLEQAVDVKGNFITIPRGQPFEIDISLIQPVIKELQIPFGDEYLANLIKKYYSHQ